MPRATGIGSRCDYRRRTIVSELSDKLNRNRPAPEEVFVGSVPTRRLHIIESQQGARSSRLEPPPNWPTGRPGGHLDTVK
jgi:hypothetical protein